MDLQIFTLPRIALKPLVPSFPCFSSIVLSLMEKVSRFILYIECIFPLIFLNLKVNGCYCFLTKVTDKNHSGAMLFLDSLQPHVDFGIKVSGGDIMSIPGLYRFVQVLH